MVYWNTYQVTFQPVVVYDTKNKNHDFEEDYLPEEADILISHKVLTSIAEHGWKEINVPGHPYTDVLMLHLDLVYCGWLGSSVILVQEIISILVFIQFTMKSFQF